MPTINDAHSSTLPPIATLGDVLEDSEKSIMKEAVAQTRARAPFMTRVKWTLENNIGLAIGLSLVAGIVLGIQSRTFAHKTAAKLRLGRPF